MTPEEIRALSIECGSTVDDEEMCKQYNSPVYGFSVDELATYTAAVEAKERERISEWIRTQRNDIPATGEEFANTIKDSINE